MNLNYCFTNIAIFLMAVCALQSRANAKNDIKKPPVSSVSAAACPPAKQLKPAQIYGLWRATFSVSPMGLPATATMLLERHAEFSESGAGFVSRDLGPAAGTAAAGGHAAKAQLAGDLEDGFISLDESSNSVSITGTWNGEMVEGSCGKKATGIWKDTSGSAPPEAPDVPFTLEKIPVW